MPARWATAGATFGGITGAVAGLVLGLLAYAPTAWFAVFEVGVPAALVGGLAGAVAAGVVSAYRRVNGEAD